MATRYGGQLAPNVYFRVYGKYSSDDDTELATGTSAGDATRMGQGGFRLDAETSPQNTLTVQGDAYGDQEDKLTYAPSRASGGNILGRWSHTFASGSDMALQVYYDRSHLFTVQPPDRKSVM